MKTSIVKAAFAAIVISAAGLAFAQNTNVTTEVKGPVTIKWASASLPRWDTNAATKGASWNQSSINWMECIRTGASSVGTGHAMASKINYNDYAGMVTSTAFQSWRGSTTAAVGEYGGRQHYGYEIIANDGSFIPANVTFSLTSQVWSGGGWTDSLFIGASDTMAIDNNQFRHRLNAGADLIYGTSDDTIAAVQTMSTPTNAFIYGGYGVGVGAYGSGSDQDKLTNALTYLQSGKFRVLITVNVPHSNGTAYTFTNVYMGPQTSLGELNVVYHPVVGAASAFLSWVDPLGGRFEVQKSADLSTWVNIGTKEGTGLLTFETGDQAAGAPQYFYRISRVW